MIGRFPPSGTGHANIYLLSIMYAVTLATFTMNFHTDTLPSEHAGHHSSSTSRAPNDVEMQVQPRLNRSNIDTNTNNFIPTATHSSPTATHPSLTEPLRINSLPRDFEPKPQKQESYLSPEEATEAGIQPPTPVMRAMRIGKEKEKEKNGENNGEGEGEGESDSTREAVIDPPEHRNMGTVTREDGRVEREV